MPNPKTRHFTATGFVVNGDATLLHWHKKVQEWLPPGGHVDLNEDPVQTTLREIKEETGFDVEIVPTQKPLRVLSDKIAEKTASELENYPDQSMIFFDDLKAILDEEEPSYRN